MTRIVDTVEEQIAAAYCDMSEVEFSEEGWATLWADAGALTARHKHEIATYADISLDVDAEVYATAEQAGRLCVISARLGGALVGYALFVVMNHPHYRGSLQATQDVLYLHPGLRSHGVGRRLVRWADECLRAKGVQVVQQSVKVKHPALGALLEDEGYALVERIYSKRLDRKEA